MKLSQLPTMFIGFFLYLLADLCFCLSCFDLSDSAFYAMHIAIFVSAAIMTVIPFILHRASLKRQFVSVIILQLVFWLSFICDSFIGFTRSFVAFSEDNYAGGLMVVLLWMLFSSISAISFACAAVVRGVKNIVSK